METPYTVYFAGELFDHKDLIGNALLASAIEKHSDGRFEIILPQNSESADKRPEEIRDQNLKRLMQCDLALFNFDGLELDSGTVVEFVFAKALDMPSVIVRSDLRKSGDQDNDGDNWNLMCSFFPRTRIIKFNALALYQELQTENEPLRETIDRFYSNLASRMIDALDSVRTIPPLLEADEAQVNTLYRWALQFPGGGLADMCSEPSFVDDLVLSKTAKGLL